MEIIIQKLIIRNFKGIVSAVFDFGKETWVHGANASGKTTMADAWYWLLFGMNSADEKIFGIKNSVQTELNELDHEVEAILFIDGEETKLRHVYREIWRKKTGDSHKTYVGNENDYFWNDVPCKLKDWNARIEKIINADTFKKITHPAYFCSIVPWQKRRETLIEMAGSITDREIVGEDKGLLKLLDSMGKKSIKDYRDELSARKKDLKKELEHIPARIDELKMSLPTDEPDFDALQLQINKAAADLNDIDLQLSSKTAAQKKWQDEQSAIQREIHSLNRKYADLQNKLRIELENQDRSASADIDAAQARITSLQASIAQLNKDKADAEARIKAYDETRNKLIDAWKEINARQFEYPEFAYDESENVCPHCKQPLPESDINQRKQTLQENYDTDRMRKLTAFNNAKARDLEDNKAAGLKTKKAKEEVEGFLQQITGSIEKKQAELNDANQALTSLNAQHTTPAPISERLAEVMKNNKEAVSIQAAIKVQQALVKEEPAEDNAAIKNRKTQLATLLTELNKQLGQKDIIANTKVRIEKLGEDEKAYSQKLADAEREESLLLRFEKLRMERINERVNGMFRYVTFKLFNTTIEGGEVPCCETMLNGVPFSDLNTAGRLKAGLDVIRALSNYYNVYAPIFIDNRESVSEIPEVDSQVINLVVSPEDTKLRIVKKQMQEAV